MTIKKLHKILSQLIEAGHGRTAVAIDKRTFYSPMEDDGATILDVHGASAELIYVADEDGGIKTNRDGSERMRHCLVLSGSDA